MATLFWYISLASGGITMKGVTGWVGVFIVFIYILTLIWDILAIKYLVD